MRHVMVLVAFLAVLGMAVGSYAAAQETPGTPAAGSEEFCATPGASPEASPAASPAASPEASPEIDTDASPAAVASEVIDEVAGGLDTVACATPATGQAPAGTVRLEGYDIGWQTADQPGPMVDLTVAAGTTIELVNVGAAPHNFQTEALGINQDMPPGFSGTVTIPADAAPGTYEFICNVPGHAPAGMVGTLTIQ